MLKRKLYFFSLIGLIALLTSCAASTKAPLTGTVYTDVKAPVAVTSNTVANKVGTAKASSIFGIVATGDASIQKAAKSAGITKISHVDYESTSVLGIYATYKVYVYGK